MLVAKGGNGLDVGGLTYWNPEMDGSASIKWENKLLTCITTVYGIANWYREVICSTAVW